MAFLENYFPMPLIPEELGSGCMHKPPKPVTVPCLLLNFCKTLRRVACHSGISQVSQQWTRQSSSLRKGCLRPAFFFFFFSPLELFVSYRWFLYMCFQVFSRGLFQSAYMLGKGSQISALCTFLRISAQWFTVIDDTKQRVKVHLTWKCFLEGQKKLLKSVKNLCTTSGHTMVI